MNAVETAAISGQPSSVVTLGVTGKSRCSHGPAAASG
jgi:hypothetical protein